jgi:hypothetical protein
MEDVGIFYGHFAYFKAYWYTYVMPIWSISHIFPRFDEIKGYPTYLCKLCMYIHTTPVQKNQLICTYAPLNKFTFLQEKHLHSAATLVLL